VLACFTVQSCELLQLRKDLHGVQLLLSGLTSSVVPGLATTKHLSIYLAQPHGILSLEDLIASIAILLS